MEYLFYHSIDTIDTPPINSWILFKHQFPDNIQMEEK